MFDLAALSRCIADHGPTARIVIAAHAGSTPREAGTSMLVWASGQSGTIGGGALEFAAVTAARALLPAAAACLQRVSLGPDLGQCCGGAVTLVTEVFVAATLPNPSAAFARSLDATPMPLSVRRDLDRARAQGLPPSINLTQGWLIEPMVTPARPLWIWGAGHVGRALVNVLAPLPNLAITWVDIAPDRFPPTVPAGVTHLPVPDPIDAVNLAPPHANHLILTYSHALDLALCHALLTLGFGTCGLIGSATKWARFRSRLAALGHSPTAIACIRCPIGQTDLGKHPQAIAIGVAAQILSPLARPHLQEHLG